MAITSVPERFPAGEKGSHITEPLVRRGRSLIILIDRLLAEQQLAEQQLISRAPPRSPDSVRDPALRHPAPLFASAAALRHPHAAPCGRTTADAVYGPTACGALGPAGGDFPQPAARGDRWLHSSPAAGSWSRACTSAPSLLTVAPPPPLPAAFSVGPRSAGRHCPFPDAAAALGATTAAGGPGTAGPADMAAYELTAAAAARPYGGPADMAAAEGAAGCVDDPFRADWPFW